MDDGMKFWNRMAKLYGPIQEKSNGKLYASLADCCRPYLSKEMQILELACGTGQLTFPLCCCTSGWEATDFSPNMIRQARSRGSCSAVFSVQDALHLPYPDHSFDLVLIANALHIIPEPQKVLTEIRRVLKNNGILLAPTFVYEGKIHKFRMWFTQKLGFPDFHKWTGAEFTAFTEAAGFTVLETRLLPADPVPDAFAAFRKKE